MYPHPAVIIYFYPRPLRGGRRAKAAIEDADEIFLSTPSARRATHELDHGQRAQVISIHALCEEGDVDRADVPEGVVISIHALCEEGDSALLSRRHCGQYFYPRPLRGGRPGERGNFQDAGDFYPRPLRGGRRGGLAAFNLQAAISIHALCEEGNDQGCQRQPEEHENFYPRPLRGGRQSLKARRLVGGRISIHALCEEGDAENLNSQT